MGNSFPSNTHGTPKILPICAKKQAKLTLKAILLQTVTSLSSRDREFPVQWLILKIHPLFLRLFNEVSKHVSDIILGKCEGPADCKGGDTPYCNLADKNSPTFEACVECEKDTQCKDKYGKDKFTMTPGLCKACDALAPRRSQCLKTLPIKEDNSDSVKEDISDQIGNDVDCPDDSDSHNWITKEEKIETDLQVVMFMEEDEFGVDADNTWFNDDIVQQLPLDTSGQVEGSMALNTTGTSVRIH